MKKIANEIEIIEIHNAENLKNKIYTIRGVQIMLDSDLAQIYGYEVRALNQQVRRNINRFPEDFMFQLTREEVDLVKSQFVTSPNANLFEGQEGGARKLPLAFTEQGIYMLATVLRGEVAEQQSIFIMRAFREMKHFLQSNSLFLEEIVSIRQHLLSHDKRIDELFNLMDKYKVEEKQGIFFQGQIFDAYAKFELFLSQAKSEIILIDGYVDLSVLERLSKKQKGVDVTIYTDAKTKLTVQDINSFNAQYPTLIVKHTTKMHDRFLIIDKTVLYHIGASLKDLGKKCFAFETLDSVLIPAILQNV